MRRVKYGMEARRIERCHKREQMAETGVGNSEKGGRGRDRPTEREGERGREREGEREKKIWIRLKKASSSLWGMQ